MAHLSGWPCDPSARQLRDPDDSDPRLRRHQIDRRDKHRWCWGRPPRSFESMDGRERLERTLRRNRTWLRLLLDHPRRREDELYLLVAGRLRVLLCGSGDQPALLDYARRVERLDELIVWGPGPNFPPEYAVWDASSRWSSCPDPTGYRIDRYLNRQEVGIRALPPEGGRPRFARYSPRDLIKSAANSEALHHLPERAESSRLFRGIRDSSVVPSSPEEAAEEREDATAAALFALGEWTVRAIEHLLPGAAQPETAG